MGELSMGKEYDVIFHDDKIKDSTIYPTTDRIYFKLKEGVVKGRFFLR